MRHSWLICGLAVGLLSSGMGAESASAQRRASYGAFRNVAQGERQTHPFRPSAPRPNAAGAKGQPNLRGMDGLPPKWIANLRDMSPEEQQRFMQNNARFQALPSQRQEQIRKNLENWNRLSPTERNALRDRERILEQMTPPQRQYLRNVLLPQWQTLKPERRILLNGRLHVLQGMTPAEREAAINDPHFMQGLSPDEQTLLRNLNSLRNPNNP